ncbi:RNA polymerase sigma factor [Spirosoma harenae]
MKQSTFATHKALDISTQNDTFDTLYKKYVKKVFQKCLSMTKDTTDAEDCTQEIFLKAYSNLKHFKNKSNLSTWLYSIAHNYCLDHVRIKKRFTVEQLSPEIESSLEETDERKPIDDRFKQLDLILNRLPADEVGLLRLKYEQNLSIQQLSHRFHVSESAIKMRLKRSREKIKALYAHHYQL